MFKCRVSGKVIIATSEDQDMKRIVMKHKSRLKKGRILIENELTWKERKVQETIYKWVKEGM